MQRTMDPLIGNTDLRETERVMSSQTQTKAPVRSAGTPITPQEANWSWSEASTANTAGEKGREGHTPPIVIAR